MNNTIFINDNKIKFLIGTIYSIYYYKFLKKIEIKNNIIYYL